MSKVLIYHISHIFPDIKRKTSTKPLRRCLFQLAHQLSHEVVGQEPFRGHEETALQVVVPGGGKIVFFFFSAKNAGKMLGKRIKKKRQKMIWKVLGDPGCWNIAVWGKSNTSTRELAVKWIQMAHFESFRGARVVLSQTHVENANSRHQQT